MMSIIPQTLINVRRVQAVVFNHSITLGLLLGFSSVVLMVSPVNPAAELNALNSRYADEYPSLSGNGRFLAFTSNRSGNRTILLYDLQGQQFVDLPNLARPNAIAEAPSISNTARYIVYMASDSGKPEIELYDRVTQQIEVLTTHYQGWVRNPKISPDGRYIVFETGSQGQWDIAVIDRGLTVEPDLLDRRR